MRRLLIFLKEPVAGQVKTRLAAEIGADAACHVYRRCVERTLERLAVLRDEITLYVEPAEATARIEAWLGSEWPLRPQRGITLGERLSDAAERAFAEGVHRVVVIGSDSPWVDHELVEEAFSAMEQADLVVGPAEDGGYYLLGLAKPAPGLFQAIPWSTSHVLNRTLAAARRLHLVDSLLRLGYDVDRLEDVRRWMDSDPCHGVTLPMSATCGVPRTMRRMPHA